jgi:hypothetical protein
MNLSNSLFRRLNVDSPFSSLKFFCLPLLLVSACTGKIAERANGNKESAAAEEKSHLLSITRSVDGTWVEVRSKSAPLITSPVRLNAKGCIDKKFLFRTSLLVLGQSYDIELEEEGGLLSLALVEDTETKLAGLEVSQEMKDALCGNTEHSIEANIAIENGLHANLTNTILSAISKIVPDCKNLTFEGKAAKCQLDQMYPQAALISTEEFQKEMIRRWSRQPYILARRTGVVSTLARVATNLSNEEGYARFCRILQFSLPEELPVVMSSQRWQTALCSGQPALKREAALYGLLKGVKELRMLRDLYQETSREGLLSVKIPSQTIPGRAVEAAKQPLRVIIAPDDEVSKKLVDESRKFLGRPDEETLPKRLPRGRKLSKHKTKFEKNINLAENASALPRHDMCWHPVFSESFNLIRVADGMKLTGDGFQSECGYTYERQDAEGAELAGLSRYLLQSLSSETEFVLDNGQSKLLRLPEGKYKYTVHVLPANPLDSEEIDDEAAAKSSGELGWGSSRTHAIRAW